MGFGGVVVDVEVRVWILVGVCLCVCVVELVVHVAVLCVNVVVLDHTLVLCVCVVVVLVVVAVAVEHNGFQSGCCVYLGVVVVVAQKVDGVEEAKTTSQTCVVIERCVDGEGVVVVGVVVGVVDVVDEEGVVCCVLVLEKRLGVLQ